jgi:hypothetical protein
MRSYVPHLQIFDDIKELISSSVGCALLASNAAAAMICPLWQ